MGDMFGDFTQWDGAWRDLETGVNPVSDPEDANGALDAAGTPSEPIYTRLPFGAGLPWYDAKEDPFAWVDVTPSPNPLPWSPYQDIGSQPVAGAYEGAYRTHGPVTAFSHEPSGGFTGDQALGRIMRFPANIPERYDTFGVRDQGYRDEIYTNLELDNLSQPTTADITTDLLQFPNVSGRW